MRVVPPTSHKVSCVSWYSGSCPLPSVFRLRGFHPLWPAFPKTVRLTSSSLSTVQPRCARTPVWALPFARRYSGNRCFFLFLRVLRCFSSPGSLHTPMDSVHDDRSSSCRVPPFRHPRLNGYLLLPAAFRSLSRLSSALSAKASALCPILLDLSFPHHVAS